jgi:hypothetical protein
MTDFDVRERRIEALERELARIQFESIPLEIEANLMRETLDRTLTTGVAIARTCMVVLDQIGDSMEENIERMSRDLNGRD